MKPGMCCLDLGCGGGDVTLRIASLVGGDGRVVGVDMDATKIELAAQAAAEQGLGHVEFRRLNAVDWVEESEYDGLYCRFLLTHLSDPAATLRQMFKALRPGGVVVVEDIDFAGHFSHPRCDAFDAYVRLYREAARRRGGDADIGPRLHGLLRDAGWSEVHLEVVQPVFMSGEGKQLALLTLVNVADTLLEEQLLTSTELQAAIDDLTAFTDDPATLLSVPRIFQLWARRP
jgi:SAM-dependent methyltransferase